MPTAPPADQRRLLAVQDLDTRADQARHRRSSLPALAAIAALEARGAEIANELVAQTTAVSDLRREVTKAEDDVQTIRARSDRDAARLAAGEGSPKDLQALQSEIDSLAKRRSDLEDVELEAMERLEAAEATLAATKAEADEARTSLDALATERDAAFADIDADLARLTAERGVAAEGLDATLVALYEKLRASHGGTGAAALDHGACGGCHVSINPATLAEIRSLADDAIVRCEECGRILVRGAL